MPHESCYFRKKKLKITPLRVTATFATQFTTGRTPFFRRIVMQCSHGAVALHTAEAAAAEVKSAKNVRQSVRPFTTPSDVTLSGTAHRSMRSSLLPQDREWTGFRRTRGYSSVF